MKKNSLWLADCLAVRVKGQRLSLYTILDSRNIFVGNTNSLGKLTIQVQGVIKSTNQIRGSIKSTNQINGSIKLTNQVEGSIKWTN